MIRRRTFGIGAALAVIGSAALLVSGHPLLDWPERGLPLGTLAAGLFVVSLGVLPVVIAPRPGVMHRFCLAALALAVVWLPASLLLAGNWRLNFSDGARSDWAILWAWATFVAIGVAGLGALAARVRQQLGKQWG